MDPFVLQLAEVCREYSSRTKWVIVPSHRLGHTLGERLVLAGTNWANLRFATPQHLALEIGGPFLFERQIEPLADELGPPLILRLLLELPASVPTYFRNLAEQPSMAALIWTSVRELRMNDLNSAELSSTALSNTSKQEELSALAVAYERHLSTNKLADDADVYREALSHLQFCPVKPNDLLIESPGFIWSALERRFLDALPGHWVLSKSYHIPAVDRPARLQSLGSRTEWVPIPKEPKADSECLCNLTAPINVDNHQPDRTLTLFHAAGKEAEVEEVVRRVLAAGVPFDQVEVACARPSEYGLLFWEKSERHGWPITLEMGIPVTVTRPARALLAFSDWIMAGFPCSGLQRLLRSGTIHLDLEERLSVGQAARLLAQSKATWGRDAYTLAIPALAESFRVRASDAGLDEDMRSTYLQRADQAERLGQWIEELLQLVPQPDQQSQVSLLSIIECLTTFLVSYAKAGSSLDGAASVALIANLERLSVLSDLRRPLAEALALVRTSIMGATVEADRARPGCFYVSSLRNAGFSGRPYIFVVGLEEGGVFPALLEDPVLLDEERTALAPNILPTSQDRVTEAVFRVVTRLACLSGKVSLSYSCRDLNENRPTFSSWIVLQAFRVLKGKSDLTFEDLNKMLGPPATTVPSEADEALSASEWWLAQTRGLGPQGRPALFQSFPALAQGQLAEDERQTDAFTIYDGYVPEAGAQLDPRLSGAVISATRLERAAVCPYQYFLEYGLGMSPLEEREPDRDVWLDPAARGLFLHEIYARFLTENQKGSKKLNQDQLERLQELGETRLQELRRSIPPPLRESSTVSRVNCFAISNCFSNWNSKTQAGCQSPVEGSGGVLVEPV